MGCDAVTRDILDSGTVQPHTSLEGESRTDRAETASNRRKKPVPPANTALAAPSQHHQEGSSLVESDATASVDTAGSTTTGPQQKGSNAFAPVAVPTVSTPVAARGTEIPLDSNRGRKALMRY